MTSSYAETFSTQILPWNFSYTQISPTATGSSLATSSMSSFNDAAAFQNQSSSTPAVTSSSAVVTVGTPIGGTLTPFTETHTFTVSKTATDTTTLYFTLALPAGSNRSYSFTSPYWSRNSDSTYSYSLATGFTKTLTDSSGNSIKLTLSQPEVVGASSGTVTVSSPHSTQAWVTFATITNTTVTITFNGYYTTQNVPYV